MWYFIPLFPIGYKIFLVQRWDTTDVKYLFKAALTDDPHRTHLRKIDVICYDPKGDVEKRYREFIKINNFRFVNFKFENILSYINEKMDRHHQRAANSYSWDQYERYYENIISDNS